jgi:hypothetical protein
MRKKKSWIVLLAVMAAVMAMMLLSVIPIAAQEVEGEEAASQATANYNNGILEVLVFEDLNLNGLLDLGEPMIEGQSTLELFHEAAGVLIPADGYDGSYKKTTGAGVYGILYPAWSPAPYASGWAGWAYLPTAYDGQPYAYYTLKLTSWPQGFAPVGSEVIEHIRFAWPGCFWNQICIGLCREEIPPPPEKSCITGYKWHDKNADGVKGSCEPLLAGWTIVLTKDGETVATTKTDANGAYKFCDLEPGTYEVWEVNQRGWEQVYPLYDAYVTRPSCSFAKGHYVVEVEGGHEYADRNFGNLKQDSCCSCWIYKMWSCKLWWSWYRK